MPSISYDSLIETLEIMSDTELLAAIGRGMQDVKEGHTYTMREIKDELHLQDEQNGQ